MNKVQEWLDKQVSGGAEAPRSTTGGAQLTARQWLEQECKIDQPTTKTNSDWSKKSLAWTQPVKSTAQPTAQTGVKQLAQPAAQVGRGLAKGITEWAKEAVSTAQTSGAKAKADPNGYAPATAVRAETDGKGLLGSYDAQAGKMYLDNLRTQITEATDEMDRTGAPTERQKERLADLQKQLGQAEFADKYLSYTPEGQAQLIADQEAQLAELKEQRDGAGKKAAGAAWGGLLDTWQDADEPKRRQAAAEAAKEDADRLDKEIAALEAELAQETWWDQYMGFEALRNNPDFEEKSVYNPNRGEPVGRMPLLGGRYSDGSPVTGYVDATYDSVNGDAEATRRAKKYAGMAFEDVPENVVKLFNYIYETQGKEAAHKYINLVMDPYYSVMHSVVNGVVKGTGALSVGNFVKSILHGEEGKADAKALSQSVDEAIRAHPIAGGGGEMAGSLGLMVGLSGSIPPGVGHVAKSGLTMAGTTAVQGAGDVATGQVSPTDYGLRVLGSGAGGAAGGAVFEGVTELGTEVLKSLHLKDNLFANAINYGLGGGAFAGTKAVTQAVIDPNYNPTEEELKRDMAVSAAFQIITSAIGLGAQTKAAKAALDGETTALQQDFYTLKEMSENGYISDTEFINEMKAHSATLRETLNTTQYVGHGKEVSQALEFLDQLDDTIKWVETLRSGTVVDVDVAAGSTGLVPSVPPGGSDGGGLALLPPTQPQTAATQGIGQAQPDMPTGILPAGATSALFDVSMGSGEAGSAYAGLRPYDPLMSRLEETARQAYILQQIDAAQRAQLAEAQAQEQYGQYFPQLTEIAGQMFQAQTGIEAQQMIPAQQEDTAMPIEWERPWDIAKDGETGYTGDAIDQEGTSDGEIPATDGPHQVPGKVRTTKEQARYLEEHAQDYQNPIIEGYKQETGLEVVVTSDEAWEEMFGIDSVRARSIGGKIYFPQSCSRWSERDMHLALDHEGTHIMAQLDFLPYLELLRDVGSYMDFGSERTIKLLQGTLDHTHITMDEFMDSPKKQRRVYDELCATLSGHIAVGEYEGEFYGEMVKLSDFFHSEQEFDHFRGRLKNAKAEFNKRKGV